MNHKSAKEIRNVIKELQNSPNSDERIVGNALASYADGTDNIQLPFVVKGSIESLVDILNYVQRDLGLGTTPEADTTER